MDFQWDIIINHLRQQAYLTKGITIHIRDEREKGKEQAYSFHFEGGIASYVKQLNRSKEERQQEIFYVEKTQENVNVELAVQYTNDYKETLYSFANNIHTIEGGMHEVGFRAALTRTINKYARKNNFLKEKDPNLTSDDVREGLTAIISIKLPEPQFEGQTKSKLGNDEVRPIVDSVTSEYLFAFLEEHPREAKEVIAKTFLAAQARIAAKAARDTVLRKGALEGLTLPGKLADCSSRSAEESELYIVEGYSAGGSAKQGRDRRTQAILPLRGKILNVEKARIDKMLANNELKSLIVALGTNIGEMFNIDKLRYHKIIVMTDADVDGAHIRTLLLTFFYRNFPQLITSGHLYIAQPPLYKLQKGAKIIYAYTESEKGARLQDFSTAVQKTAATTEKIEGVSLQRYKGLGEMNPSQLWETTMNPESRMMKKVTIEDAERADEVFDILMGSEVAPRKRFIQSRAQKVKNLDI